MSLLFDVSTPAALLDALPVRSFFRVLCSESGGDRFLSAMLVNLQLSAPPMSSDRDFIRRFGSDDRSNATGALSELWLAAHFLRVGATVSRPSVASGQSYDFHVVGSASPHLVNAAVEVKRLHANRENALSQWDRERIWGSVPSRFEESEFPQAAASRLNGSSGQLGHALTTGSGLTPVLAIDVTDSRTFQRLLLFDPTEAAVLNRRLHDGSRVRRRRSLLLFAAGFDRPELWAYRWLPSPEA